MRPVKKTSPVLPQVASQKPTLSAQLGLDGTDDFSLVRRALGDKPCSNPCHRAISRIEQALRDAIWAADYLSEQQAMPDTGYQVRLESAKRSLPPSE